MRKFKLTFSIIAFLILTFGFTSLSRTQTVLDTPSASLEAPSNFKIESGDGVAHLTWDSVSNAKSYWIYISDDGKNFKPRFSKPWIRNEITIPNLENGKTYYYGIASVNLASQISGMVVQTVVPNKTLLKPKWVKLLTPTVDDSNSPPVDRKEYGEWLENHKFTIIGTPGGDKSSPAQPCSVHKISSGFSGTSLKGFPPRVLVMS